MSNSPSAATLRRGLMLLAVLGAIAGPSSAEEARRDARVTLLPAYSKECAACHTAYPPGLLPAPSWRHIMDNLPRHFGTDASLDAATVATLSSWLVAHAATGRRAGSPPAEDRITRSAWFAREHREIAPAVWRRPAVNSPSNCTACHVRANQGEFNEHDVRIPR